MDTTVLSLINRLRAFRDERNWGQFHSLKDLAISVSIEAGELLEIFQWLPGDVTAEDIRKSLNNEVADVLIYLLLLCDAANIDPIAVANQKIDQNEERFPVRSTKGVAKPSRRGVEI